MYRFDQCIRRGTKVSILLNDNRQDRLALLVCNLERGFQLSPCKQPIAAKEAEGDTPRSTAASQSSQVSSSFFFRPAFPLDRDPLESVMPARELDSASLCETSALWLFALLMLERRRGQEGVRSNGASSRTSACCP